MPTKRLLLALAQVVLAIFLAIFFTGGMTAQASSGGEDNSSIVANGDFEGGGSGDPYIPNGWYNAEGAFAFQPGELLLQTDQPLSGTASLEINTLDSGPVKRKLYIPLEVDLTILYEISFQAKHISGEYVSVTVRNAVDGSDTIFLQAIGDVTNVGAIRGSGRFTGTYFNDNVRPYLVIQTHGPTHVLIDDISIKPLVGHGRQWDSWTQQRMPWGDEWHTITEEIVTPHTTWAKPFAGEEMRVVTVMPRWRQRWAVELSQRMSVAYDPVIFADGNTFERDYWIRDEDGEPMLLQVMQNAMEQLTAPAGCIVVGHLSPSAIPPQLSEAIMDQVEAGAGLVILGYGQPFYPYPDGGQAMDNYRIGPWARGLNEENRTDAKDVVVLGPVVGEEEEFYRYGEGRIAVLRRTPVPEAGKFMRGEFEAEISYIMKAMLWASGRQSPVRMEQVELPGESAGNLRSTIDRADLPAAVRVTLTEPMKSVGSLVWWFDDYNGGTLPEEVTFVDAGQTQVDLELPKLAGGVQWLHMQLTNEAGEIHDWTTASIEVKADPGIQTVDFSSQAPAFYQVGDMLIGKIMLSEPVGEDYHLHLRLVDADGHLWQDKKLAIDGNQEIAFALSIDNSAVLMHNLEAELVGPGGVADRVVKEVGIAREAEYYRNTYAFQIWQIPWVGAFPYNYLGQLVSHELRKVHGVTVSYRGDARINAFNNIRSMRTVGGNSPGPNAQLSGEPNAPQRVPCITSPGYLHNSEQQIIRELADILPYAPIAYEMGHEVNLLGFGRIQGRTDVDICFSPSCQTSFRNFLRGEYGDLSALNASWGTEFADWEQVGPAVLSDALENNQVPRWIDHRRHMDRVLAGYWRRKLDVVQRYDPDAIGIADNAREPTSYSGVDYWLLFDQVIAGSGFPVHHMRAFAPEERKHLTWARGAYWWPGFLTPDEDRFRRRFSGIAWRNLFQGMRGFAYYAEVFHGWAHEHNMVQPMLLDLRTTEAGRWGIEPVARIRTGIDRLIFESVREDSGIAILYSRSSEHAATAWQAIQGGGTANSVQPARQFGTFSRSLELLGFQFSSISEDQVIAGDLDNREVKLLVLPFSQAIDPQTAAAIKEFVAAGGIVLADVRPGISDKHGALQTPGLLDDLFGVRHDPDWKAYQPTEQVLNLEGQIAGVDISASGVPTVLGPVIELAGAVALDEQSDRPLMAVNEYGDGVAILLNFAPLDAGSAILDVLGPVLADRDFQPIFEIVDLADDDADRQAALADLTAEDDEPADAEGYLERDVVAKRERPTSAGYVNGNIYSFAFWHSGSVGPDGIDERVFQITPPKEGHVYDLTTNEYLGRQSQFEVWTKMIDFRAYAVLPYQIEQPRLSVQVSRTEAGNPKIESRVQVYPDEAADERHPVRLMLFGPDGEEWTDFAATVVTENGTAEHVFLLPLNAPQGGWRIEAREAISGLSAELTVDL